MSRTSSSEHRRWTLLLWGLGLLGCAQHRVTPTGGKEFGDAAQATTDGPAAGLAVDATNQAVPEWLLFDDFEGGSKFAPYWAVNVPPDPRHEAPEEDLAPPRSTSRRAMRLKGGPTPGGVDANAHHHFNWGTMFSAVRFWARAESPASVELMVSLTDLRSDLRTFHEDQTDGIPWRIKRVTVGPEWRQYTIAFEELVADTPGMPPAFYGPGEGAQAGSELHLVLSPNQAYDVWVDDVELKCRPEACASIVFAHSPP
jgi:hypothetical protein